MNRISILSRSGLALLAALVAAPAQAAWTLNMDRGVTDLTGDVYELHMLIFWICVVIGIGVFGAMLYSVIVHRKSRGFKASHFHESTWVEVAWTVVPFIILIAVAIPAAGTLLQIEDSSDPDMTIRVTGYQWLWEYDYVDTDVHFFSRLDGDSDRARQRGSGIDPAGVEHYLRNVDNPVVVPVDKKVRLLLTSGDVIHSWWVPELGGKKDAIPGYINDMWFKANEPGTYRGQCAELCGRGHAFMPIVVKAVPQDEYDQWVAEQGGNTDADSQLAQGQPSNDAAAAADAEQQTAADESPTEGMGSGTEETPAGDGGESANDDAQESERAAQASQNLEAGSSSAEGDSNSGANGSNAGDGSGSSESGSAGDGQQMSMDALMSQGEQVYANLCAACHQPDGSGMEAAGFPAMVNSPVATGDLTEHIDQILNGKGAMPPYRGTLDDTQIAAVVTYERNAFGNETGDVVQPARVAEQR